MSGSTKRIDARGQACPGPVIMTKRALEEGGFEVLEVIVDGPTAKENVSRFATHAGHSIETADGDSGSSTIRIRVRKAAGTTDAAPPTKAPPTQSASPAEAQADALCGTAATTVFISSDRIGSGDDELGALLMRGFLRTLAESGERPARVILMNGGVKLAIEGAQTASSLASLADAGTEVLACGTCLDFYKVKDKLAVGRVSNMLEISGLLLAGRTLNV
jgi:selenium metabolism protein YedF